MMFSIVIRQTIDHDLDCNLDCGLDRDPQVVTIFMKHALFNKIKRIILLFIVTGKRQLQPLETKAYS